MKPIFEKERLIIKKYFNIDLPQNMWRDGSRIYVNHDSICVIQFKIDNGKTYIKKNIIKEINNDEITVEYKKGNKIIKEIIKNETFEEEYFRKEKEILELLNESVEKSIKFIKNNPNHELRISDSSGKDSKLVKYILEKYVFPKLNIGKKDYIVEFYNTTNEIADTYLNIKQDNKDNILEIHNPNKGWYQWIKEDKNYYIPSAMIRNCCDKYKHGRTKEILDINEEYILFLGMRKYESSKRSNYDWDLNEAMGDKCNVPLTWKRFLPIVNWKDEFVWLFILHNEININKSYYYGLNRIGCLICPYSSDFNDLVVKEYFPSYWNRWVDILKKNYEIWGVEKRLKWTLEEWINGRWKQGTSKEYELTRLKATKERIKELAEIKNVDEIIAEKYFNVKCKCCNKKLNPDEVAMCLKMLGRNIDKNKMMCKKHFCEEFDIPTKEYTQKKIDFRNDDCNLF